MFTKTVCPTCKVAKQQLSFLPVPVEITEYNIEDNDPNKDFIATDGSIYTYEEYLTEKLESMSTPTFEFEDGTVIRGFEMGQLMEKLGL